MPTDTRLEAAARAAADANGDDFDNIPKHKPDWIDHRGEFQGRPRDINEPFQTDYENMARAAVLAFLNAAHLPDYEQWNFVLDQLRKEIE